MEFYNKKKDIKYKQEQNEGLIGTGTFGVVFKVLEIKTKKLMH